MKKNITKIFIFFFLLFLGMGTGLQAQNYFSKPEAKQNLVDAAKYLASTLDHLEETDLELYKVNKEKLRFIKKMLAGLKTSTSVAEVAEKYLPKAESNVFQPAVRFIDTGSSNKTPGQYIRSEIMFLISY